MRYRGHFILFVCFVFSFFAFSEEQCSGGTEDPPSSYYKAPRFCFFSLNGKDESEGICEAIIEAKLIQSKKSPSKEGLSACDQLPDDYKQKIEIKEYYAERKKEKGATEEKNIEDAFRNMTKDRCDALAISGHHVGYFTGSRQKNREREDVTLTLDFLEKFSCDEDENCQAWFKNVKMLHLHGARTWGADEKKSTDEAVTTLIKEKYPGSKKWGSEDMELFNREYSHTVDTNNPLNQRYLRIFPQASVLAWSKGAVPIQESIETFTAHFEELGGGGKGDLLAGLNNFFTFLQDQSLVPHQDICRAWEKSKGPGYGRKAIHSDQIGNIDRDRKIGCDLSQAIANNGDIAGALSPILKDEKLIHQNLNRMIQALHFDNSLTHAKRTEFIEQLKGSDTFQQILTSQIENKRLGIVRRADYLALYNKIPFSNNEGFQQAEDTFFNDVLTQVDENKNASCESGDDLCERIKIVSAQMLSEIIWKNNLGLLYKNENLNLHSIIIEDIDKLNKMKKKKKNLGLTGKEVKAMRKLNETITENGLNLNEDTINQIRGFNDIIAKVEGVQNPYQVILAQIEQNKQIRKDNQTRQADYNTQMNQIAQNITDTYKDNQTLQMHSLLLRLNFDKNKSPSTNNYVMRDVALRKSILKFSEELKPFGVVDNAFRRHISNMLGIKGKMSREEFWNKVKNPSPTISNI